MRNQNCCSNEKHVTKITSELKVSEQKSVSSYDYNEMALKRGGKIRHHQIGTQKSITPSVHS